MCADHNPSPDADEKDLSTDNISPTYVPQLTVDDSVQIITKFLEFTHTFINEHQNMIHTIEDIDKIKNSILQLYEQINTVVYLLDRTSEEIYKKYSDIYDIKFDAIPEIIPTDEYENR